MERKVSTFSVSLNVADRLRSPECILNRYFTICYGLKFVFHFAQFYSTFDLFSQKQWDEPLCRNVGENLFEVLFWNCGAHLLVVGGWESGLWLSILSTLLDNNTFRAAIWLRIGASFCMPHSCQCGEVVNGLSCNRSADRFSRHARINEIIRRVISRR